MKKPKILFMAKLADFQNVGWHEGRQMLAKIDAKKLCCKVVYDNIFRSGESSEGFSSLQREVACDRLTELSLSLPQSFLVRIQLKPTS